MGYKKPLEVKIQLTEKCNLACSFCFNRQGCPQKREMPHETAKKAISMASEEGIKGLRLTGGEPMLHKSLGQLLSHSRKKGLLTTLNTNACLANKENLKDVSENADTALISVHSLPSKKAFDAAKQLAKGNCTPKAATILTKENIQSLEKFHKAVTESRFSQWVLLRQIPNPSNKNPVSAEDMQAAIEKIEGFNKTRGKKSRFLIENAVPFCCFYPKRVSRVALGGIHEDGHSSLFVDPTGTIRPSYFLEIGLGTIQENSLKQAWNSGFMQRMNRLEFIPETCHHCSFVMKCMAGSRFSALQAKKSLYALDPLARPSQFLSKNRKKPARQPLPDSLTHKKV